MTDGRLLIFGVALILALAISERIGSFARKSSDKTGRDLAKHSDRISHILTSTFGLLALLIGFTFSIALNRYDTRRQDVVLEANAISTAHYRAGFVDPKYGAKLQNSLESYARHRLAYGRAGPVERDRLEYQEAGKLRQRIGEAGAGIQPVAATPLGASIIASINEVLDLSVQREANMNARIPWTVFAVLVGISSLAAGMMGFAHPLSGRLRQSSSILLFILMAMTIVVILDLDRPARGSITIDQTPMQNLVKDFQAADRK